MILAIVKYIAVHKSPKNFLRYIMNSDKTEEMKLVTGLNCTANLDYAYNQFSNVFEKFAKERFCKKSINSGKEKIHLHHYIQSFKPEEVTPELAHKIGVEWAEKVFGENHQMLVTTHIDKNRIALKIKIRKSACPLLQNIRAFSVNMLCACGSCRLWFTEKPKIRIMLHMANFAEMLNCLHIYATTKSAVQLEELVKLNHLTKFNLRSEADIESHRQELE